VAPTTVWRRGRRQETGAVSRSSLLDLKIGTVLKAYAIYLAIGLVIFLIGLAVLLSRRGHESNDVMGLGGGGNNFAWSPGAGDAVSPAEFRSVASGAQLDAVRHRFGKPAGTGPNPFDLVSGDSQTCLGYRLSGDGDKVFLFCFESGRLVDKKTF
jgi:hypothetical protein